MSEHGRHTSSRVAPHGTGTDPRFHGITVNNLLPGYTLTGRIAESSGQAAERTGRTSEDVIGDWEAQIPAGRLGTPEEFGAAAAFLCSEQAAYITGISLSIDGGWNRGLLG